MIFVQLDHSSCWLILIVWGWTYNQNNQPLSHPYLGWTYIEENIIIEQHSMYLFWRLAEQVIEQEEG
jgi:hypothetical protein